MSPRRLKVGIKDVAERAGVSVGTVSHVINQPERVSEKRRQAVQDAIESLGYVPNHAARQLKVGSSSLIAYLIPNPLNPYYMNLAHGIMLEAERRELHVVAASSFGDVERAKRYVSLFEQQRVRGLIVSPKADDLTVELANSVRGTPVVLVSAHDPAKRLCSVQGDDLAGGRIVVEHLIKVGKRHIVVVAPDGRRTGQDRWLGAQMAAREHPGVQIELLSAPETTIAAGREVAEALLRRPTAERPDGIFTTSDLLGIGVLHALTHLSELRVPEDVAVVGYDDLEFSASTIIPLTTMQQHELRIGEIAVDLLEDEWSQSDHVHRQVFLDPVLIERASSVRG